MSDDSIHVIITIGIIALMFAWVPILGVLCPSAWRTSEGASKKKKPDEGRQQPGSVSSLTSRRFADQSRDLLDALSTRGGREIPDAQVGGTRVPPGSCAE